MKRFKLLAAICFIIGLADFLIAGTSSKHMITIRVQRPNALSVLNGSDLKWTTDQSGKRISVSADSITAGSNIQIQAVNCEGGLPLGAIPLSTSDQEIVKTDASTTGGCSLDFKTDTAPNSAGSSPEQIVICTITDAF